MNKSFRQVNEVGESGGLRRPLNVVFIFLEVFVGMLVKVRKKIV